MTGLIQSRNQSFFLSRRELRTRLEGSGNLEVLVQSLDLQSACEIEISTAATGFGAIWQAVMNDFNQRWQLADCRIAINDMGATPAVVSLRMDQAIEACLEQAK